METERELESIPSQQSLVVVTRSVNIDISRLTDEEGYEGCHANTILRLLTHYTQTHEGTIQKPKNSCPFSN